MGILLTAVQSLDVRLPDGPVYRTIIVLDVEGSTTRTNRDKRELRRGLYGLTERALETTGIIDKHLEPMADRGDGVMILIRPDDEVPKTMVVERLIPTLTRLLHQHNAAVARPELQLRLRAVVHAGEVHEDENGFFGDDIDTAFRLLEAPRLKRALKEASGSPLILVVSEEVYHSVIEQENPDADRFRQLVRVRVGHRFRRGWVSVPVPARPSPSRRGQGRLTPAPLLAIARLNGHGHEPEPSARGGKTPAAPTVGAAGTGVSALGALPRGPG
jgi:class 3 adenylate cyclase